MNLTALAARAVARFRDTTGVYDTASWKAYVNDAYMDVVTAFPNWPFLEARVTNLSVTGGTGTVSLPTDGFRVNGVYDKTNEMALSPLSGGAEYLSDFPAPAQALGTPEFYRLRNNVLEVYPWPSATTLLYVDLFLPPTELTDTDEPVFPEQYHRALVDGALMYAYLDQGNVQQSQLHESRLATSIRNMASDLLQSRTETFQSVVDLGV